MASWIKKNMIGVTRADSLWVQLSLTDADGNEYVPAETDVIKFGLKQTTSDEERPFVEKIIPNDTLELKLTPEDTDREPGLYWYDVEVTMGDGTFVDTVIPPTKFKILEEVGNWRRWDG